MKGRDVQIDKAEEVPDQQPAAEVGDQEVANQPNEMEVRGEDVAEKVVEPEGLDPQKDCP
jgi:hypothetical protein